MEQRKLHKNQGNNITYREAQISIKQKMFELESFQGKGDTIGLPKKKTTESTEVI